MHSRNLRRTMVPAGVAALAALAGCGSFETRSIVLDLRILSMVVSPPEVLVPLDAGTDPMNLPQVDVQVCALIADPADAREIEYRMTACWPNNVTLRCDDPARAEVLLTGTPGDPYARVPDPEQSGAPVPVCATLSSNAVLPVLILDQVELQGSYEDVAAQIVANGGNLDVQIELAVRGAGQGAEALQYGVKTMRYALPLPEGRQANQNPAIATLQASVNDGEPAAMPVGRCIDVAAPLEVGPGDEIEIEPVPVEGAREEYLVPTFDGGARMFTENLVYTWYATHGTWEPEQTGGPKDVAGNDPEVESLWTAPGAATVGDGLDVSVWVVQRDERGGQSWIETCVRVTP
jgi:hypothetical protein